MKIVIDIPNENYVDDIVDELDDFLTDYFCGTVCKIIPLPKGHGDLIDRNELLKTPMNTANCPKNYVNIAQAIIEADTGEKE